MKWASTIAAHQSKFEYKAVLEWPGVLDSLTEKISELKTDQLSWSQVLKDLERLFGGISTSKISALCKDPNSLVALVLSEVASKPD